jgi:hypothetical protein
MSFVLWCRLAFVVVCMVAMIFLAFGMLADSTE